MSDYILGGVSALVAAWAVGLMPDLSLSHLVGFGIGIGLVLLIRRVAGKETGDVCKD